MDYKFKVGDKVITEFGDGVVVSIDIVAVEKKYLVKIKGFDGHGGGYGYDNKDGIRDKKWCKEEQLTLIEPKQNLRGLLQVGCKVLYKYSSMLIHNEYIIENQGDLSVLDCIWYTGLKDNIIAVYRPKYNGLKPMEWELVWERKEPKYVLQCPLTKQWLGYSGDDGDMKWWSGKNMSEELSQKEIDSLSNQDYIKSLIKKEVTDETK